MRLVIAGLFGVNAAIDLVLYAFGAVPGMQAWLSGCCAVLAMLWALEAK